MSTKIPLLPLEQQRRTVDLVATIEGSLRAAEDASGQASRACRAVLEEPPAGDSRPLGELAALGSGPSWRAEQEAAEPQPGALPVIGITNTRPDGQLDMSHRRFVSGLPASVATLSDASLVMIRTNGNRARIGNVYRVTPDAVGCAFSAFQIGVHPYDSADSSFLFWYLRSPSVQGRISAAASGTTGLGNIAVKWLRDLQIPWPSAEERRSYVETAEAIDAVALRDNDQADGLRDLRSALLASLLSGDHRIPGSYDALLETVP